MDNSRDELDRLIDGALASYSNAEPLAGLEERVLNRVRVGRARRRVFAWAVGFAVAATVVVVGIVIRTERQVAVPKPMTTAKVTPAPAVPAATKPVERVRRIARRRQPRVLPKLEQFPAPAPLTAEERALLALVERSPREAQVVASVNPSGDGPIQIPPVEIAPLPTGGAQ